MKRLAALLTMTALFAVPSTAQAKGPIGDTEICGDGGCAAVSWDRSVGGPPSLDLFFGQGTSVPDPPPGPYYELRFTVGDSTEHVFVLPGFDVAGTGTAWFRLPPQVAGPIRDGAHSLRPYRVRLASVMVGRTRVENPATYMSLFSLPPGRILASEAYKHSSQWVAIAAITTRTTPWSLHADYDPVLRAASIADHQWTPVPAAIADRIDTAAGLGAAASLDGGGSDAARWVVAGLTRVATAAGVVLLARRRRPRPGPAPVA